VLTQVLHAGTLRPAGAPPLPADGDGIRLGRDGAHTEALAEILGEMQALARSLPGGVW
jgi:ring-1,2-phenylacetyl-CoA epoxidase subunit PaaC